MPQHQHGSALLSSRKLTEECCEDVGTHASVGLAEVLQVASLKKYDAA